MCHFLWISEFVYIDNNCIDRYAHRRALADTESTRLHRTILLLLLFQYWNFRNAIDDFLCRLIIMIIIFVFAISPRLYVCVFVFVVVLFGCVCVYRRYAVFGNHHQRLFYILDNVGKCRFIFFFLWSPSVFSSFTPFSKRIVPHAFSAVRKMRKAIQCVMGIATILLYGIYTVHVVAAQLLRREKRRRKRYTLCSIRHGHHQHTAANRSFIIYSWAQPELLARASVYIHNVQPYILYTIHVIMVKWVLYINRLFLLLILSQELAQLNKLGLLARQSISTVETMTREKT